ncbi:MAG: hypothetical protein QW327_04300 [Candidatus Odinarchaeota archaeon]
MTARPLLAFIFSLIFSWVLIYFIVLGSTLNDFVNGLTGGLENVKTDLFNICVIQFSAYPMLLIGQFMLMVSLIFTGLLIGLICGKYGTSLIVILLYSTITFLIPFIILVSNGFPPLLAVTNILFLFIGPSIIHVILNLAVYEAILILPALLGAAII